jgi:energy-converting hydrogenase Eha subunit B
VELRYTATEVIPKKVRGTVIVYPVVALIGGLISCLLLWPYGALIALLSMPVGGSLFALTAAVVIYIRASNEAEPSDYVQTIGVRAFVARNSGPLTGAESDKL